MVRTAVIVRKLIVALLIFAQAGSLAFAASAPSSGPLCPVHVAAAPVHEQHAAGHHDHAAADAMPAPSDENQPNSTGFGYDCCTLHGAAVLTVVHPLAVTGWADRLSLPVQDALTPGELPSTDPPPRTLL